MTTIEKDNEYIASAYGRFPVVLASGKGATAKDENGKEYIDLGSGIGVNSFGYCDSEWVDAVTKQLSTLQHTSNLYYTKPGADLAELLCEKSGMKKCFFGNSGAEANECAIKTARKYSLDKYKNPERNIILSLNNSFHGRTLATLTATGQDAFHTTFGPFPDRFMYTPANDFDAFEKNCNENVCAVMMEMIQGEGGVMPLDKIFVKKVYEFCEKYDILVIADEVQTGNGRTGKMYAYQNYDILPDIAATAKGVAGGLPMGVCMFSEKTANVLTPGSHGSTFGMNPVVAAGALSIVKRLDDKLFAEVIRKGDYIRERLSECKNVKSIAGMGLMLGVETTKDAKALVLRCIEKGILPLTAKNKLRLLPPLNITDDELKKAMDILTEVIDE